MIYYKGDRLYDKATGLSSKVMKEGGEVDESKYWVIVPWKELYQIDQRPFKQAGIWPVRDPEKHMHYLFLSLVSGRIFTPVEKRVKYKLSFSIQEGLSIEEDNTIIQNDPLWDSFKNVRV